MTTQSMSGLHHHDAARRWTIASWLAPLLYIGWLVVMFVLGYWVTSLFDFEPGQGANFNAQGTPEWIANALFFLVLATPNWLGAWFATFARREGAGTAAKTALWVNLVMGAGLALAGTFGGGL